MTPTGNSTNDGAPLRAAVRNTDTPRVRDEDRKGDPLLLALIIIIAACAGAIVLFHRDANVFLYYGDAVSHLARARQFVDSRIPGVENIGTVWLPLPHLLLLPFTLVDRFFYTGIAGPIVGIPCLAGTGVLLFLLVRRLSGSRAAAWVSALVFTLNPNVVYMALTPMSESCLLFFLTLGGWALLRWVETFDAQDVRWLGLCSAAVACAGLCRYEAWLAGPFVFSLAVYAAFRHGHSTPRATSIRIIALGVLSCAGIVLWLLWNHAEYGDALKFARWTSTVSPVAGREFLHNHPRELFVILITALMWIFGPVLVLAAGSVGIAMHRCGLSRSLVLTLVYFSLPPFFTLCAIIAGTVQVDQWWWNWRYVLPLGLLLTTAGGEGIADVFSRLRSRAARTGVAAALLAMPLVQLCIPSVGVATYEDARKISNDVSLYARHVGDELRSYYDGGSIALLTGFGQAQRIMISSTLPLRTFHIIYDPNEAALTGPLWEQDRYLILSKDLRQESSFVVTYWLSRRETLLRHYTVRSEDDHYLVLERKESVMSLPDSPSRTP